MTQGNISSNRSDEHPSVPYRNIAKSLTSFWLVACLRSFRNRNIPLLSTLDKIGMFNRSARFWQYITSLTFKTHEA